VNENETGQPLTRVRPVRLRDITDAASHNDLDEPEDPLEAEAEHGRIGYGRFGEWSPYGLAALIILTIIIGAFVNQQNDNGNDDDTGADDREISAPEARGPAPAFTTTLFTGENFDLSSQQGKIVVVNFWASWCEPCRKEMPAMQQLAEANPDVVIIGIAASNDKLDKATAFAQDVGVTYPLAMDTGSSGPNGKIASSYQVFGFPATFFINTDGQIVDSIFGAVPLEDLQTYIDRAKAT
jgi:thiol-disulfide isomerase/thioredoxin